MADVLVSPLGRSPGAVSGVYFALQARGLEIEQVTTVGTSHPDVRSAADNYLTPLFKHQEVMYDPIHVPGHDLKDGRRNVAPYVAMAELALKNARGDDHRVHAAVTGGRSGMGALIALATNFYGADNLWHLWVKQDIEERGTVDKLHGLVDPVEMERSQYLNPTVAGQEGGAYQLVDLPFVDLRPLHEVLWTYRRTGKVLVPNSPLTRLLTSAGIRRFDDIFPAGMTFAQADRILNLAEGWAQTTYEDHNKITTELGEILEKTGGVEPDEKQWLFDLVTGQAAYEELFDLAKAARKDRLGFWKWLVQHKEEIDVAAKVVTGSAGVLGVLFKALELYLKAYGYI